MNRRRYWVVLLSLLLFGGCRSIDRPAPDVRGGALSLGDLAYVRSVLKGQKLPVRWIDVAGQQVDVYTEDKIGGGIVYTFWRGDDGRLEGGFAGFWD